MTVFLAGNELEIFSSFAGSGGTATTSAEVCLAGVNRAGVSFNGHANTGTITIPSSLTEGWLHARISRQAADSSQVSATRSILSVNNSSGQSIARVRADGNDQFLRVQAHTGTEVGGLNRIIDVDINWKIDATAGFVRIYVNGALATEFVGVVQFASGVQSVSQIVLNGISIDTLVTNFTCLFSQILVADTPTIGARVHTLPLTVSTTNQWTGTPANVTGTASAGTISESTVDEEISFNAADFATTLQDGYGIEAMVLSSRAQALAGSPVTRIQGRTRIGGTPYNAGGSLLLTTGFTTAQHIMPTNPATSTVWTVSDANSAEFGLQAKA